MHVTRLIIFSIAAAIVAVGVGMAALGLGAPVWLCAVIIIAAVAALTAVARRVQTGRWGFGQRNWVDHTVGESVRVIFDERLVFLNRLTLVVAGDEVARDTIWYGTKTLTGAGVTVRVGSGWIGECTGVTVLTEDGTGHSLIESR